MKKRPAGFLMKEHISHSGEIFDYIQELHWYLWRFVDIALGSMSSGSLDQLVDRALTQVEKKMAKKCWPEEAIRRAFRKTFHEKWSEFKENLKNE